MTSEVERGAHNEPPPSPPLLSVRGLSVAFPTRKGPLTVVRDIGFVVGPGDRVAVVGESGSGKSITASAILRLVPPPGAITGGAIHYQGRDLVTLSRSEMRRIRGGSIGLVPQDPFNSLNPVKTIGWQVEEALALHTDTRPGDMKAAVADLLRSVGLRDPEQLMGQYPHELSGGMSQRAVIAMALAGEPELLLADEPTTALDATTQAGILELLIELSENRGKSTLLITHDMGVVARFATHVIVMYAGEIVEIGTVHEIFHQSAHPYARGLLESIPRVDRPSRTDALPGTAPSLDQLPTGCAFNPRCFRGRDEPLCAASDPELVPITSATGHVAACHFALEVSRTPARVVTARPQPAVEQSRKARAAAAEPLVEISEVTKEYPLPSRLFGPESAHRSLLAVDRVSLRIDAGECLAVVGESGCGKSTLARLLLGLTTITGGTIRFRGADITRYTGKQARTARQGIQAVFQDPGGSLNPQMRVGDSVAEPLAIRKIGNARAQAARAHEMLERVGIPRDVASRFPHQFSGGQKQRIALARALVLDPTLIVCDEPLTSLDVSVQSQILALLRDIQVQRSIAYLFISHDLAVIRQIAQRVVVMYLGLVVETADVETLFDTPAHPYTAALLDARPAPDPVEEQTREHIVLTGSVPSAYDPPSGCPFHTRCWKAQEVCRQVRPPLAEIAPGQWTACHFPLTEDANGTSRAATAVPDGSLP